MRIPILQFAKNENVSARFLYKESVSGRLVLTKVGSRTFVDDVDAAAWRALAPKVSGAAGNIALQAAEQHIEHLGKALAAGQLDPAKVRARLAAATEKVLQAA